MTTENQMAQTLDALPDNFDFSDPNALAQAMGYDSASAEDDDGQPDPKGESASQEAQPASTPAPAPAASAPAAAPAEQPKGAQSSEAPAAATNEPAEVVGVQTKDGKHTLPYAVLQEARRAAALNKARAAELEDETAKLKEQIESLKSGKAQAGDGPSEAELAKLAEDFPQLAPVLQTVKALQAQVASAQQAAPKVDPRTQIDQELDAQAELDAALAARPLLSKYQAMGGVVWSRAVEIDANLMRNPAFAGKSLTERFTEVERQLAGEMGIQVPVQQQAAQQAAPQASAPQPQQTTQTVSQAAIESAPQAGPSTLSDISGTIPKVEQDPWDDRNPIDGLAAAEKLSDEALMRMAGLNY